jgi:ATP-dependent Clp protease ATP-binding subunit ClpA
MFERFTERARQVVVLAQEEARTLRHNYIGTEHFLIGLLREEEGLAARVLNARDITEERVRVAVVRIIGTGDEAFSGQIPFTPRMKKVLEIALREALSCGHNYIGTEHLLLALLREHEGVGMRIILELIEPKVGEVSATVEALRNDVFKMLAGPEGRKADPEERIKQDIESAHWVVEVTYVTPEGRLDTKDFGDWDQKPDYESDSFGYLFSAHSNKRENNTVIIPAKGAISIELKQVIDNG